MLTAGGVRESFGREEWGLLASAAVIWGSSFMFTDLALETLAPTVVAMARVLLGAVALAVFPQARRPIQRADMPMVALLGLAWMAVPFLLFPLAQQHVDSSVAGIIAGAAPLFTAVVAAALARSFPHRRQVAGLLIGFLGVLAISVSSLREATASVYGVVLLLLGVASAGAAFNLAVPLQQRYGSLPVLLRAQVVATALVLPFGLGGIANSALSVTSGVSVLILGVVCTGIPYVAMTTLVGRVGGPRGSISVYFVPVVAAFLGVVVLKERVVATIVGGSVLVLAGAWLTSRGDVTLS